MNSPKNAESRPGYLYGLFMLGVLASIFLLIRSAGADENSVARNVSTCLNLAPAVLGLIPLAASIKIS